MTQQEVITMLEALIALGRRLGSGLRRSAAAATGGGQIRYVLLRRADERATMVDELQLERDWLAGAAVLGGLAAAPADSRGAALSEAPTARASNEELLVDCERADGRAVDAWRDALEQSLPRRLRLLLQEQHRMLLRSHRRTQVLLHLTRHGNVLLPLKCAAAAPPPPVLPLAAWSQSETGEPVRHD